MNQADSSGSSEVMMKRVEETEISGERDTRIAEGTASTRMP